MYVLVVRLRDAQRRSVFFSFMFDISTFINFPDSKFDCEIALDYCSIVQTMTSGKISTNSVSTSLLLSNVFDPLVHEC